MGHIQEILADIPYELIRFQLDTLNDPKLSWQTVQDFENRSYSVKINNWVWGKLAEAYFPIDPVASIEIQLPLIEATLTMARTSK